MTRANGCTSNDDTESAIAKINSAIAEEIDRENEIITDLLSLVKMDKTSGKLNIETVNINELLELPS